MTEQILLNRVLIKTPGFFRTFEASDGRRAWRLDIRSVSLILDELISLSAVELAFTPRSPALVAIPTLSPVIRDRVRVLDQNLQVDKELEAFLKPMFDEFGLESLGGEIRGVHGTLPEPVARAFTYLFPALYDLFLAARHQVQIDIDLARLKQAVDVLRAHCQSADARAHFSALSGVLNTYQPLSVPSLFVPHAGAEEQERRFKYLVEDLEYRNLSEAAALLGIPDDARRALRLMKRALAAVIRTPILRWGAKAAVKQVTASNKLSELGSDLGELLTPQKYLPPIVSLRDAYGRALEEWSRHRVPAAETDLYPRLLREGFTEVVDAPQPTLDFFQGRDTSTFVRGPEEDR